MCPNKTGLIPSSLKTNQEQTQTNSADLLDSIAYSYILQGRTRHTTHPTRFTQGQVTMANSTKTPKALDISTIGKRLLAGEKLLERGTQATKAALAALRVNLVATGGDTRAINAMGKAFKADRIARTGCKPNAAKVYWTRAQFSAMKKLDTVQAPPPKKTKSPKTQGVKGGATPSAVTRANEGTTLEEASQVTSISAKTLIESAAQSIRNVRGSISKLLGDDMPADIKRDLMAALISLEQATGMQLDAD